MVWFRRAVSFLDLIRFEHTVFALPFAYLGMVLAAGGWPSWHSFAWITVAMTAARTLAMSANRLADASLDARNPRTASRPLVVGTITPTTVWVGAAVSTAILGLAAFELSPLAFGLFPGAVVALIGYPFTKRFTLLSHFILGATDALAPLGAWAAIHNSLALPEAWPAWLLFAIVTLWIGGFDLIYACQDIDVDRREGLFAIPARFGPSMALRLSALCHALTTILLVLLGFAAGLAWPYAVGVGIAAALLAYEHAIVRPDDLSRLNLAFFNVNGILSLTLFAATLAALLIP